MNLEGFSYNLQQTESKSAYYRTGDKACQRCVTSLRWAYDVTGLPPVTISLVTRYNCFLTVEDYTKDKKFHAVSYHTDVVRGQRGG